MTQTATIQRERRTPVTGWVAYRSESGAVGKGYWLNVGRTGAAIRLGRELRPGEMLSLRFASPLTLGGDVEVAARVIWCRPLDGVRAYAAGLQIRRDAPEAALAFSSLGYRIQWVKEAANSQPQPRYCEILPFAV
ncbi:MAG TPA: PilZ domain-containing protein [Candidatus Hydrogenedentes bacterium]|nr:PilZ domain-containing protein [Candidatus Hydrogenedentota bacterium]